MQKKRLKKVLHPKDTTSASLLQVLQQ